MTFNIGTQANPIDKLEIAHYLPPSGQLNFKDRFLFNIEKSLREQDNYSIFMSLMLRSDALLEPILKFNI